jgi:hypothetical protein
MKLLTIAVLLVSVSLFSTSTEIKMSVKHSLTIDSLGACQGVSYQQGKAYLYGDREVGMIRQFSIRGDSVIYLNNECKLTIDGKNIINHPTGIAYNGNGPAFMGNSVRLNKEGTVWKAVIYCVDWEGMWKSHTLDGNLLKTIDDDACIQGTRPEYVKYHHKWYVATADYGNHGNEVRLYDPEKLKTCAKTSEPGVLYKKFTCTPWVQNLNWVAGKGILVLVQNQIEGRKWRFTYVDLEKSIDSGKQEVIKVTDIDRRADELEGFALTGSNTKGIAVTSSRKNNVNFMKVSW